MRIRSIKPEFWRSPDISCLNIEDRLLFVGLWSYVDDNGVGEDRESMIAADLFADDLSRDPSETFARVSRGLANLFEAGRIVRYEVSGRRFLAIENWGRHQRIDKPAKPRFPAPTGHSRESHAIVASVPEIVAPGTGEQGNREQRNRGAERASAPLSPFCSKHPTGTEDACRSCGTARTVYELAQVDAKSKPTSEPFTVLPGTVCLDGMHTLLKDGTCTRCEYRAEVA
ncbi:hypothetical protein [Microbacterium sp. K41]|uniref:hypothetical protein n=1 Tax=Microbacterium sp. K41 TaxID=2305437 RepID=UPI00109C0ACE|nr:hypothetical protein [Microbacterium sp. K41]